CWRRYACQPHVQEAGTICQSQLRTEDPLRRVAGKFQSQAGARNVRERFRGAKPQVALTECAGSDEAHGGARWLGTKPGAAWRGFLRGRRWKGGCCRFPEACATGRSWRQKAQSMV